MRFRSHHRVVHALGQPAGCVGSGWVEIFRRLVRWVGSWVSLGRLLLTELNPLNLLVGAARWPTVTEPCASVMCITVSLLDAIACTCFLHLHSATLVSNYWCNLCWHYSVLKVIVIVPKASLLVALCVVCWVGSQVQIFLLWWAGLGCVNQLMGSVGLGQWKWTHGQLWVTSTKNSAHKLTIRCERSWPIVSLIYRTEKKQK